MMRKFDGSTTPQRGADIAAWRDIVVRFQQPSIGRALWQIVNTFVPYSLLWVLMYFTVQKAWWVTLPLAVLAGAFLVRIFIIFHDCGHGSFFSSRSANSHRGARHRSSDFHPVLPLAVGALPSPCLV